MWRNAPMRVLSSQGDLVDSYDPALKERRTVCFLGVQGPAPGRLGARDFFEAAQGEAGSARCGGEAEDPGRAGRQARAVRLRADGLRAGPRGAGEAGLCGQCADFAGAVWRLPQREDAARERAAHEFGAMRNLLSSALA